MRKWNRRAKDLDNAPLDIDFSVNWHCYAESTLGQRYEFRWNGRVVYWWEVKADHTRRLTLEPLPREAFEFIYKRIVKKLYDFKKETS